MPRSRKPPERMHLDKRAQRIIEQCAGLPDDLLITRFQLCDLQGTSLAFVNDRIADGTGPVITKLGSATRFKMSDVRAWWRSRAARSTAEYQHRTPPWIKPKAKREPGVIRRRPTEAASPRR